MTQNASESITRLKASILGLLSKEPKTKTIITQRLTTAGYKDKEVRDEAIKSLLDNEEIKLLGNIVPMMPRKATAYKLSAIGEELVEKINSGEVEIIG